MLRTGKHGRYHHVIGTGLTEHAGILLSIGPCFHTAYVEARRVHVAIPRIEWRDVQYSVPPQCLGQKVEVRHEVDSSTIEIRWASEVVGTHTVGDATTGEVWDAGHWEAAQQAALGRNRGRHPSVVLPDDKPVPAPLRLDIDGLAAPGLTEEEDRSVLLDEAERGQVVDQFAVEGGLELEVEVDQRPPEREPGEAQTGSQLPVDSGCGLLTHHPGQELDVAPFLCFGLFCQVAKHSAERLSPRYPRSSFSCS